MKRYYYLKPKKKVDIPDFEEEKARSFRDVLESVENGLEELGNAVSKGEYDFPKGSDSVDTSLERPPLFMEKLDLGAEMATGDYSDRLADRLGFTKEEGDSMVEAIIQKDAETN